MQKVRDERFVRWETKTDAASVFRVLLGFCIDVKSTFRQNLHQVDSALDKPLHFQITLVLRFVAERASVHIPFGLLVPQTWWVYTLHTSSAGVREITSRASSIFAGIPL
jgi:hypothetical protein